MTGPSRDDPAAVIDPGPAIESHIEAVADAVGRAARVVILLTHAHADHAEAAPELARRTGAPVHGPGGDHDVADGQSFPAGGAELVAVSTPGHARRHFCYHFPLGASVFVGDLLLGEGNTTWVGEYSGAVAQYLASLDRLEALGARTLHPSHGPSIARADQAIARFRSHRLARIDMVRQALADGREGVGAITRQVYGELPPEVRAMARASVQSILDYLSGAA